MFGIRLPAMRSVVIEQTKEETMRMTKSLVMICSLGLLLLPSITKADEWNKLTKITFSGPVQVENTQLPAGTYTFKLMDDQGDRHIVQIFNEDQTHLIATVLAMPDFRLKPAGTTAVKFAETSDGSQAEGNVPDSGMPIKEWFYPGDSFGQEFRVVPAKQVAAVQPEPSPEAAATPAPAAAAESPQPAATAPAAATPAPEPAPQAAPAAVPQTTDQTSPTTDQQSETKELPKTASQMPLVGLIGLIALAAAASFRILLKVSA
jgi:hypothetical protein